MLFKDKLGNILVPEEVDELSAWEIEDLGIHIDEEWSSI